MERRKAVTAAAAASLTLLAGAAGMALSSNIVGVGANDDVGQLSPVVTASTAPFGAEEVRPTDRLAPPPTRATEARPTTASTPSGYDDEDEHDQDREHEVEGREEEHEYEGRDDDD